MDASSTFPEWLEDLSWREAWLTLEATEPATLPPYLGSTLRGALGHLLRAALCDASGCGQECQHPDTCRYYALFERSRSASGQSLPKSFVLLAPPPPGLEEIATGGAVTLPYQTGAPFRGEPVPTLRCEAGWKFDPGGTLRFGLRLLGVASNVLPAIIAGIARCGLVIGVAGFRLVSASDNLGQMLYSRWQPAIPVQMPALQKLVIEEQSVRRIRILFLLPTVYKPKSERAPAFAPEIFAARFFEHSMGRAREIYQTFSVKQGRVPWVDAPRVQSELVGHRMFHYDLPRHSYRQDKWIDYDGVVGYIDLAGELSAGMPWARAAEILHFGERATSGLGKIRVLVLD